MRILIGALAVGVLVGLTPMAASAGWTKTILKDEMRATNTVMYTQEVLPIRGQGPKLILRVFDKNDGAPTAMLDIDSGRADGCPEPALQTCDLQARFDDGEVQGLSFATKDGKSLIPANLGAFSGAVLNATALYIEIPIGGSFAQYRYDLAGIDVKYTPGPSVSLMGFDLGVAYPEKRPDLKVSRNTGDHVCYTGENVKGVFAGVTVSKASLCFYKNIFYQALVTPGSKNSYIEGYKYFVGRFGKPDPDGIYPTWPADSDKLIKRSVREASYFAVEKNRYDYPFIITDEAWKLMIPKLD